MRSNMQHAILIIDDEKRFTNILAKRLSLRGYPCEVAYDGESGLNLLGKKNFKIVLLDLRLPGLNGEAVLRCIKKEQPELPVIILTGHGNKIDEERCLKLEAHSFLNKPVDILLLISIFEKILNE